MIGKSKALSIYPFVFHLYIMHDTIRLEDKKVYMVKESTMKHNVKPDEEDKLGSADDSKRKSLDSDEIAAL